MTRFSFIRFAYLLPLLLIAPASFANDINCPPTPSDLPKNTRIIPEHPNNTLCSFIDGYAKIVHKKTGGYGMIDTDGHAILHPIYLDIKQLSNGLFKVERFEGWLLADSQGRALTDVLYADIGRFYDGLARVKYELEVSTNPDYPIGMELTEQEKADLENMDNTLMVITRYGFINEQGMAVIPTLYEDVSYFSEGLASVKRHGKYGYINKNGDKVIDFVYDHADDFSQGLASVRIGDKRGYIDTNGEMVIAPMEICCASQFENGKALVKKDDKYGFINRQGDIVVPIVYDRISGREKGLYEVVQNGKTFMVDEDFKPVLTQPSYDERYPYNLDSSLDNTLYIVVKDDLYGIVSPSGDDIQPLEYDYIENLYHGRASFLKNGYNGYFDAQGRIVIPAKFASAGYFNNGVAVVARVDEQDYQYGFIDYHGNMLTDFVFDAIKKHNLYADDFVYVVQKNDKYGVFDASGSEILPPDYDSVNIGTHKFLTIQKAGLHGVMNSDGEVTVPVIYPDLDWLEIDDSDIATRNAWLTNYVTYPYEALAKVKVDDKYGIINNENTVKLAFAYDDILGVSHHYAVVKQNGKYGAVNRKGDVVIPFEYDYVGNLSEGLIVVGISADGSEENMRFGFINLDNDVVIPPTFRFAYHFEGEHALVYDDKSHLYIDKQGRRIPESEMKGIP